MSLRSFTIFIVFPAIEIFVFVEVVKAIGFGWALLLIVAAAGLGAYVMRIAGAAGWRALRGQVVVDQSASPGPGPELGGTATVQGRPDGVAAADAALLFLAGLLLFLPGYVSDVAGLLLLLPPVRALVRGATAAWFLRRFTSVEGPGGVRLWVRDGRRVVPGQVIREDGSPGGGAGGGAGGAGTEGPAGPPMPLPPGEPGS